MEEKRNQQQENNFKLTAEPSPSDSRDFIYENTEKISSTEATVDYRDELLPIRNQGSSGTCVGQSGACMKEWQEIHDNNVNFYFSPQFIYNLRTNQNSEGMFLRDLMKILSKVGVVTEMDYPYGSTDKITDKLKDKADKYRILNYAKVTSIQGLKDSIKKNGPCVIVVPVYNYSEYLWRNNRNQDGLKGLSCYDCCWI